MCMRREIELLRDRNMSLLSLMAMFKIAFKVIGGMLVLCSSHNLCHLQIFKL